MTAQKEFVTFKLGTFQVPIYFDLVRITEIDTSKARPKDPIVTSYIGCSTYLHVYS
jgi:hypothetical protein